MTEDSAPRRRIVPHRQPTVLPSPPTPPSRPQMNATNGHSWWSLFTSSTHSPANVFRFGGIPNREILNIFTRKRHNSNTPESYNNDNDLQLSDDDNEPELLDDAGDISSNDYQQPDTTTGALAMMGARARLPDPTAAGTALDGLMARSAATASPSPPPLPPVPANPIAYPCLPNGAKIYIEQHNNEGESALGSLHCDVQDVTKIILCTGMAVVEYQGKKYLAPISVRRPPKILPLLSSSQTITTKTIEENCVTQLHC